MPRLEIRSGKFLGFLLILVLIGLGGLAWIERTNILSWYHVYRLSTANDFNRQGRVEGVCQLGEGVFQHLLDGLASPDPSVCANLRAGLQGLVDQAGGIGSDKATFLITQMASSFPRMHPCGQYQVLEMISANFSLKDKQTPSTGAILAATRLMNSSSQIQDESVQSAALALCMVLMEQPDASAIYGPGRDLVRNCLQSPESGVRRRAIRAAMNPAMDLMESLTAMLQDPSPEVRQAVMLAIGPPPANKVISDETLLPSLRDPDPEVRRLCEQALKSRGLGSEHLALARLLGDPDPLQRLQILDHLRWNQDLDPGVWLRRLSHDPAASVRAAAVRMMSQQRVVDLTDRMGEMAQTDPSPTVGYLASVYLQQVKKSPGSGANNSP